MPQVSIVMPVFRTPEQLMRDAIESVIAQTMTDWELVIVEDPSDRTGENVIASFNDERIRYVLNNERTGLVAQRNRGLKLSQGQFIAKHDSDDISECNRLQRQVEFLQQNPEIGVVGSFLTIINETGDAIGYREYPSDPDQITTTMRRRNVIAQPAAFFRRSIFEKFGGYPEGYPVCQDYAYWSHLAKEGVRFANLPERLVRYRQHGQSIKSRRLRETLQATIRIKREYWGDQLDFGDRCRIVAENCMRFLPTPLVLKLFSRITFRRGN